MMGMMVVVVGVVLQPATLFKFGPIVEKPLTAGESRSNLKLDTHLGRDAWPEADVLSFSLFSQCLRYLKSRCLNASGDGWSLWITGRWPTLITRHLEVG